MGKFVVIFSVLLLVAMATAGDDTTTDASTTTSASPGSNDTAPEIPAPQGIENGVTKTITDRR